MNADAKMSELPVIAKAFPLLFGNSVHIQHVPLPCPQLGEDQHPWTRAIDPGPLDEYLIRSPSIVDPHSRSPWWFER